MTDRLTPAMLRDLAGLFDMPAEPHKKFSDQLHEEAARREAEAAGPRTPTETERNSWVAPIAKSQGPDSAAALDKAERDKAELVAFVRHVAECGPLYKELQQAAVALLIKHKGGS